MKAIRLALSAVVAVALASAAFATVQSESIDPRGTITPDKTDVIVTGTVVCTDSTVDGASVAVILLQTSGGTNTTGTGSSDPFTCSGTVQAWTVVVPVVNGTNWKPGPASAIFAASDASGSGTPVTASLRLRH